VQLAPQVQLGRLVSLALKVPLDRLVLPVLLEPKVLRVPQAQPVQWERQVQQLFRSVLP
jgi:hypothetical protein